MPAERAVRGAAGEALQPVAVRNRFGDGAEPGARIPLLPAALPAALPLGGVSATGAALLALPSSASSSSSSSRFLSEPGRAWLLLAAPLAGRPPAGMDEEPGLVTGRVRDACGVIGSLLLPVGGVAARAGAGGASVPGEPELVKLRTTSCCHKARLEYSATRWPMSLQASKQSVDNEAASCRASASHP